jgi:O-antigen/teichoic acid export membrane protein
MKVGILDGVKTLLFNNITVKQTIFKNYFWLIAGAGVNRMLKLVLMIYAARILGVAEYGKFSFALAFVSLFIVFHDFGLPATITREFAREKEKDKDKEFYSIISFTIMLAVGVLMLILIGSFFITSDPGIRMIIFILALFSLINGFSTVFYAFFQARQRMEYQMWAETLQSIFVVGIGLFVLFKMPTVNNFSYSYLFAAIISFIFVLIFFNFKIFPLKISWEKVIWKKFFMMTWPLALAGSFGSLYSYTDSVIMGYLGMINETGWYNAAYRISWTAFIFIGMISSSFYPVLSENFSKSKEIIQKVWSYEIEIIIVLIFLFVPGGIILAPRIISFVYGAGFSPSILVLQILMITTGITLFYTTLKDLLIVANLQKKFFIAIATGAIINIILNLILIPRYSLYGSAIATTITHFLILIILSVFILKYTSVRPSVKKIGKTVLISIMASLAMYFFISRSGAYNFNIFISIIMGAAIYFSTFFSLKYLKNYIHV